MDAEPQMIANALTTLIFQCTKLSKQLQNVQKEAKGPQEEASKIAVALGDVRQRLSTVQHGIMLDPEEFTVRMESLLQFKMTVEKTIKACSSLFNFVEKTSKDTMKASLPESGHKLTWEASAVENLLTRLDDQKTALAVIAMLLEA